MNSTTNTVGIVPPASPDQAVPESVFVEEVAEPGGPDPGPLASDEDRTGKALGRRADAEEAHPAAQPTSSTPVGGDAVAETLGERARRARRPTDDGPAANYAETAVMKPDAEILEVHELAEIFPRMVECEYDGLKESIEKNGLLQSLIIHEGKILDGRHRDRACRELGIARVYRHWDGPGTALDYVLAMNLNRRHLGQGQKALAAARLAGLGVGRPGKTARNRAITQPEAAIRFGVGRTLVQDANEIIRNGTPELIDAVEEGRLTIAKALRVAEMRKQDQGDFLRAPVDGSAKPKLPGPPRKQAEPHALPVDSLENLPQDDPTEHDAADPSVCPSTVPVEDLFSAGEVPATASIDEFLCAGASPATVPVGGPLPAGEIEAAGVRPTSRPENGVAGRDPAETPGRAPRAIGGYEGEPQEGGGIAGFERLCVALDLCWLSVSRAVDSGLDASSLASIQGHVSRATAAIVKIKDSIDRAEKGVTEEGPGD